MNYVQFSQFNYISKKYENYENEGAMGGHDVF